MRNNIRILRMAAGLKQSGVATKAGIPQETLSRYESGKLSVENMTLKLADAMAKALGCTVEDLYKEPVMAEKTIYIVRSYYATIKDSDFEYSEGCTLAHDMEAGYTDITPKELLKTESFEEALAELAKHRSFARKNGFSGEWDVTEYWIDSETWDFEDPDDPIFLAPIDTEKYAEVDILD